MFCNLKNNVIFAYQITLKQNKMSVTSVITENNGLKVMFNQKLKRTTIWIESNYHKTNDDVIKYNSLFAEFLCWEQDKNNPEIYETPFTWEESGVMAFMAQRNDFSISNMDFTTDLNWIDLVIEKLEKLNCLIIQSSFRKPLLRVAEIYLYTTSSIVPCFKCSGGSRLNLIVEVCYHAIVYLKKNNIDFTIGNIISKFPYNKL